MNPMHYLLLLAGFATNVAAGEKNVKTNKRVKTSKKTKQADTVVDYKEMYEQLLKTSQQQYDSFFELTSLAGAMLDQAQPLDRPVVATCHQYCNFQVFAPGCENTISSDPSLFDNMGYDACTTSAPLGLGLMVYQGGPCCSNETGATPCLIQGPGADVSCEPCSDYPPQYGLLSGPDLFPRLSRTYDETTGECRNEE